MQIRTAEIRVQPARVTPALLAPCLSNDVATEVVDALEKLGVLHGGFLEEDARARVWVRPVSSVISGKSDDSLTPDESCIAEVLNVAWAKHEMVSQYAAEMLDFCEGKEINENV